MQRNIVCMQRNIVCMQTIFGWVRGVFGHLDYYRIAHNQFMDPYCISSHLCGRNWYIFDWPHTGRLLPTNDESSIFIYLFVVVYKSAFCKTGGT